MILTMRKVFLLLVALLSFYSLSTAKEVPFTQEDRDRLIRLEEGQKFLQKQIDKLRSDFRTYMSIVIGSIIALVGFIIWDRRTAISPVVKKTRELEDRSDKIEKVLKDLAKRNPEIEEALKRAGLL